MPIFMTISFCPAGVSSRRRMGDRGIQCGKPRVVESDHALTIIASAAGRDTLLMVRTNSPAWETLVQLVKQLLVGVVVFVASVVLCAIGGGLLGKFIAVQYPSYYPSVFPTAATQPDFDATEVGIGTGVGQGAAAGLFVGAVSVLALAIANRRRGDRSN
jgi:hypothetical protein